MKTENPAIIRTQRRLYSAHHDFLRIAEHMLPGELDADFVPSFDDLLVSLTFSALAVEAFANAIGDCEIEDWRQDYESLSPLAKLRMLAEHLEVPRNKNESPWSNLVWLMSLRNRLAHPKPETLESIDHPKTFGSQDFTKEDPPRSKLERDVTLGNARQALTAVRAVVQLFAEKLPLTKHLGVIADGWHINVEQSVVTTPP